MGRGGRRGEVEGEEEKGEVGEEGAGKEGEGQGSEERRGTIVAVIQARM